jgi:hypothetical protein
MEIPLENLPVEHQLHTLLESAPI